MIEKKNRNQTNKNLCDFEIDARMEAASDSWGIKTPEKTTLTLIAALNIVKTSYTRKRVNRGIRVKK